ncbi:hypothetical protein NDU88_006350 [Pleurodeles waltl]|uniref:Uncharacterized protein n=1 Tax=Pleurodeles waltl TaxID=8319 RepID=A0AAV7X3G3_PLEWA|nr:hypothetical protein NDU88_006350 [Pleurodeles waltl]
MSRAEVAIYFTEEEIEATIGDVSKNKAPGPKERRFFFHNSYNLRCIKPATVSAKYGQQLLLGIEISTGSLGFLCSLLVIMADLSEAVRQALVSLQEAGRVGLLAAGALVGVEPVVRSHRNSVKGVTTAVMACNIEHGDPRDTTLAEKFASQYLSSTYYKNTITELEKLSAKTKEKAPLTFKRVKFRTSFCHQLNWTTGRSVKNLLRSPQASIAQLSMTLFLALVTGIVFFGVKNNFSGIQNSSQGLAVFTQVCICKDFLIEGYSTY